MVRNNVYTTVPPRPAFVLTAFPPRVPVIPVLLDNDE